MQAIGRRTFVLALATTVAPRLPAHALAPSEIGTQASAISLDQFLALSVRLTGHERLDRALGSTYLDAITHAPARATLLHGLVRDGEGTPAHAALAREIIESWYTGVYQTAGRRQVATHAGALVWQVIGRPAPAACASVTGDWSTPPAEHP